MKFSMFLLLFVCVSTPAHADIIAGFDIGGKFVDFGKYSELKEKMLPHEYYVKEVKFFDYAQVGTDEEKIIHSLTFQKKYKVTMSNLSVFKKQIKNDYKTILNTLEAKYGEFDNSNAKNILGEMGNMNAFYISALQEQSININPKTEKIGVIFLSLVGKESKQFIYGEEKEIIFILSYLHKKLVSQIKKQKKEELEGF